MKSVNEPENTRKINKCQVCDGAGKVRVDADTLKKCDSCKGNGLAEDRLRKVLPMNEMDFIG